MKIALTGAAGIGKTTLAEFLAAELDLPLIAEDFREIARAFNPAHPLEKNSELIARCRVSCLEWLHKRALTYEAHPAFVEDRCAIDVLFRWLMKNVSDRDNNETMHVINLCSGLLGKIDYLIILPLFLTQETANTDGLIRAGSISRLFRAQSLAVGVAHQLMPPAKIIMVPKDCWTVDARRQFVLERIGKQF